MLLTGSDSHEGYESEQERHETEIHFVAFVRNDVVSLEEQDGFGRY
jgi:hypothetical protein